MAKKRWTILAVGLGCGVASLVLVWLVFFYSNPLKVTVRDETDYSPAGLSTPSPDVR